MAKNFSEIAFTSSVKAEQEKYGSRRSYARMEKIERGTEFSFAESDFIAERDSFYLATVGENNYPYVQFRGGSKGFLRVLDQKTLAFADFRGNLQYISVGNLKANNKAALILIDYPRRQRLKIYAEIEIVDAADQPELIAQLEEPDYKAVIERAMVLHLEAFDWNCPQHITPRYTIEEIKELNAPVYEQMNRLQNEIEKLKSELEKNRIGK
ncbi:MAG: pyridoxamine 5'-phosphate oxidase family protein [Blastocatellia bacterium]|nr:pyridoxamine 5'-phosphate oxidase family protein [Blastocatellia bacterium]